ncbi:MAG: SOS response-associated peptidase [Bacteroidales bacterium]|jgi:putative SOS response-associated peptidase YedK|nr:SOS response-associated peptidase [Bacteroidales bacterium]
MCFTVNVNLVKEEIEERYGISFPGKYRYEPSYYYHAFGLPELPAICPGNPAEIRFLKWGLIPSWVKTDADAEEIRLKTFNARVESIESKPSFSSSFRTKRCIIPVRGFYEWQHTGRGRIPWYIYSPDDEIISLAGLFSEWIQTTTGEVFNTFTIITTGANKIMAEIHNSKKRMPAILSREDEMKWIDITLSSEGAINLLKPSPEEMLKAHTISPLVNNRNANRNTPEVIKPFNYNSSGTLF